jgi:hypothetical protein
MVGRTASVSLPRGYWLPLSRTHPIGRARSMRASILQSIFHRVQVSKSERLVLDVILSKANMYGKHARVAHEVIQAITGLARSTVYAAIARLEKICHLLRVERKVLWPGHNAINIYHVVIPWRQDPLYNERKTMGWDKHNFKGPKFPDSNTKQEEKSPAHAAQTCSEPVSAKVASTFWTTGSEPWYFAQGLTPPAKARE